MRIIASIVGIATFIREILAFNTRNLSLLYYACKFLVLKANMSLLKVAIPTMLATIFILKEKWSSLKANLHIYIYKVIPRGW